MNHILGNAIHALFTLNKNLTTIPTLLSKGSQGEHLRRIVSHKSPNKEVRRFWTQEFPKFPAEAFSPILNRFSTLFLDDQALRTFSRNKNKVDIPAIMNGGKILIVALPLDVDLSSIIGGILVAQIQKAALGRINTVHARMPFFLFVDEFHRFSTGRIVESIINETVKGGLYLAVANQETGQLSSELLKAVLSVPNIMVFGVNYLDAKRLCPIFNGQVEVEDLLSLQVGEVYSRLDQDIVNFKCPAPLKSSNRDRVREIIQTSHRRYYTSLKQLETSKERRRATSHEIPLRIWIYRS